MDAAQENAWWMLPENYEALLVFFIDEGQEEHIFGPGDTFLRCMEEHSNTLIQLESWFTASGQTRVTVVGPQKERQWVMNMIWKVGNLDTDLQAEGKAMLQQIRSRPLTQEDVNINSWVIPRFYNQTLDIRIIGVIFLKFCQNYFSQMCGRMFP